MPVSRKRKKKKPGGNTSQRKKNKNWEDKLLTKLKSSEILQNAKVELGSFNVKVSELILDYGSDLISWCRTEADYKKYVPFIILCWNTACLPEEEREDSIRTIIEELNVHQIEKNIRDLIKRKLTYFGEYNYTIADYHITMLKGGDMHLSVASMKID